MPPLRNTSASDSSFSVNFDRAADFYDQTRGFPAGIPGQIADGMIQITGATASTRCLEIGVGTGRIALPLIERGIRLTGVDISAKMMAKLQDKVRQTLGQAPNLELLVADATQLPFADQSFEVVITVHVLHLISGWRQVLAEIERVLASGGLFLYGMGGAEKLSRREFTQQWRQILAGYRYDASWVGASTDQVKDALQNQGIPFETHVLATWPVSLRVGDVLALFEQRAYSNAWPVPDPIFSPALQDLRTWAIQTYGSEDTLLEGEESFEVTVARPKG